ncbi:MAG: tRNA (guanine-N7)-methyltransferase [Polyangiaceae bacterium]|nr:tRNA (guanine-N7)-methyltransferase [Polyangiaceae bacterium]
MSPRPNPYAHAPRLPEGDAVALDSLFAFPGGPVELEVGPGRGAFILERAAERPETRLLGLEIRRKWATLVDERLRARGFGDRARVVCEDARVALGRLAPDASVAGVFIHFPDPWWKKRHEKRLVMGDPLLDAICRLLVDGGEVFLQTDVATRAAEYAAQLGGRPELEPAGDAVGSPALAASPHRAESNREKRALADGLPLYRLRYRRRPRG